MIVSGSVWIVWVQADGHNKKQIIIVNMMNFIEKYSIMHGSIVLLVVLMLVSSPLWARGAYKWTDDNGVVHYSDRMQAAKNFSVIKVRVNEPVEVDSAEETEEADEDGVSKSDSKAIAKKKKIRRANCNKAREQLATNESMSRMFRVSANGGRKYLSNNQRADVIRRSLDSVKYWCH